MTKVLSKFLTTSLVFVFLVLSVHAESTKGVQLTQDSNNIMVSIKDITDLSTIKLSFNIKVIDGKLDDVKFNFTKNMNTGNTLAQYRYDEKKGVLNVYVSSKEKLNETILDQIGVIELDSNGKNLKAEITINTTETTFVNTSNSISELEIATKEGLVFDNTIKQPEQQPSENPSDGSTGDSTDGSIGGSTGGSTDGSTGDSTIQVQESQKETETSDSTNILIYVSLILAALIGCLMTLKSKIEAN